MTGEHAQPGQYLHKNITARQWNRLRDVLEQYRRKGELGGGPRGGGDDIYPTDVVKVQNLSCSDRLPGEVLEICTTLVDLSRRNLWFTAAITGGTGRCYGVVRRALPENAIDELQVSGACLAWVQISDVDHNRCDVEPDNTIFQSNVTGPVRILWHPGTTGLHLCAVVIESPCHEGTTTTTDMPPAKPQPCTGMCTWQWSTGANQWQLQDDGCAQATTTTSTTVDPTALRNCYCSAATTTTSTTSTTTSTTTTTTPDCNCLYPLHCGEQDGEETSTYCSPESNQPPPCGTTTSTTTTTASPTTTTTCDCATTTTTTTGTPDDCSGECTWAYLPAGGLNALQWVQLTNECPASCPCPQPGGTLPPDACATASTNCEVTVPPVDPRPSCGGDCEFWWIPDATPPRWIQTRFRCSIVGNLQGDCGCAPPSDPGNRCAPARVPCTRSAPTTVDPCTYVCYPTTTTTTTDPTTTTTTDPPPCSWCRWEWDPVTDVWGMVRNECDPCPCAYPSVDGGEDCEIMVVPCGNTTRPPTTTTDPTTTTTTTTTTGGPTTTTTTTCDPTGKFRIWECVDTPPGCCNGVTTAGPGCSPYWQLNFDSCCAAADQCLIPNTPCDCEHVGHHVNCPCGSTECTTTTTTTPCPDCVSLGMAGTGCVEGPECCCAWRCNLLLRMWELDQIGTQCEDCPSAAICVGDNDHYNSCLDGTIGCMDEGINQRCRYCACDDCTTTTGGPTTTTTPGPTTTTGGPTTTTTCGPGSGSCLYIWQMGSWQLYDDTCAPPGNSANCIEPEHNGEMEGEISSGSLDCCGN